MTVGVRLTQEADVAAIIEKVGRIALGIANSAYLKGAVSDPTRSLIVISDVSNPDPPHPGGNHEPFRTRKNALRRAVSAKRPRDTSRAVCYSELVDWLQRGLAGRAPSA